MNKPYNMNSRFIRIITLVTACTVLLLAATTCTTERAAEPAEHRAAAHIALDWNGLLRNLVPVISGNLAGGAGMVGLVYWVIYRRPAVRE